MRRFALLLILLCIASLGQAPAVKGGTVTGSVVTAVRGKRVNVDDVFVYLESTTKPRLSLGKGTTARIEQKGTQFSPRITVIPRGAKIYFPNRDDFEHNVFSPAMKGNEWDGFDLFRYGPDKVGRHRDFLQEGEFDIYCDIHKEMWAKVKVVPTLLYTRVVDGKYTFRDVPPGTYTVVTWAPDSRESRSVKTYVVEPEQAVAVESLPLQYTPSSHVHQRVDGRPYVYKTP